MARLGRGVGAAARARPRLVQRGADPGRPVGAVAVPDRHLIVNADDFGFSPGVNRGIAEAHERGIVTSASLMVRWPAAAAAASYARARPELSVGLHLDLGEWVLRDGAWVPLYE